MSEATRQKVEAVLEELRPFLKADGGDVELVDVTDEGVVKLRLKGACGHCPSASVTLEQGIKVRLQEALPEITEVVAVG